MDHETAAQRLSEWVTGRLDAADEAAVRDHVGSCDECGPIVELMQSTHRIGANDFAALTAEHPDADTLVAYVVADLATDEMAVVGAHVRVCPTCSVEAEIARASVNQRSAPRRATRSPLRRSIAVPLWVPTALAAMLIVFIFLPRDEGGSPRVLPTTLLSEGTRAETTQLALPGEADPLLLVEYPRGLQPADGARFTATLVRSRDGTTVWSDEQPWDAVFDADVGVLALVVPRTLLEPGPHELRMQWGQDDVPPSTIAFEVTE